MESFAMGSYALTCPPWSKIVRIIVMEDDSLTSSVLGLNAKPNTAICFPAKSPPIKDFIFSVILVFWWSLAEIAASIVFMGKPLLLDNAANAWISLGKQEPPNPGPGCKNFGLILPSCPIAFATWCTSAPTSSHKLATSLM